MIERRALERVEINQPRCFTLTALRAFTAAWLEMSTMRELRFTALFTSFRPILICRSMVSQRQRAAMSCGDAGRRAASDLSGEASK